MHLEELKLLKQQLAEMREEMKKPKEYKNVKAITSQSVKKIDTPPPSPPPPPPPVVKKALPTPPKILKMKRKFK